MESLETAINYWEDALAAYSRNQSGAAQSAAVLLTAQEAEFCRSLERVLQVKRNKRRRRKKRFVLAFRLIKDS